MADTPKQRLKAVHAMLSTLIPETVLSRREIFGPTKEPWQYRLLQRLVKDELVVQVEETRSPTTPRPRPGQAVHKFQAVDGLIFAQLCENEVALAEWYYKREVREEEIGTAVAAPDIEEEQKESSSDIGQKILDALIQLSENVVYLREEIAEIKGLLSE